MSDLLTVGGTPVPIAPSGWIELDGYPSEDGTGVDRMAQSAVTDARGYQRAVQYESPDLPRAAADDLEALLDGAPLTVAGGLIGGTRTAIADDLTVEPSAPDPARYARVTCRLLIDPPES